MQKVIKRELIDTLQYMKIPHNRKFVDSRFSIAWGRCRVQNL